MTDSSLSLRERVGVREISAAAAQGANDAVTGRAVAVYMIGRTMGPYPQAQGRTP
jgi:hypothetical protein